MGALPFNAGTTFESLRDSDFDSYSAYGEPIDNSLQAGAQKIQIKFSEGSRGELRELIFSDDGSGMTPEVLQNCLRLGWSSRYNDRSGVGRFGVGMTLGAIHECRRVVVYSKTVSGTWHTTYLDLDEIENADRSNQQWLIPKPQKVTNADLEKEVPSSLIPTTSGTLVVWSKYDRAADKVAVVLREFNVWVGRTYRHFIWGSSIVNRSPVSFFINGEVVPAIDPLYVQTEKTRFPKDEKATESPPITFDWPISEPSVIDSLGRDTGKIVIRLSLLPKSFRSYQGAGGSDDAKRRYIDQNEGFSIIRNGREVAYGWIPHFGLESKDIDRFWGCEISFGAELDRSFTVKNIKRGAVPSTELKKVLREKLGPWIKNQRDTISQDWKQESKSISALADDGHPISERIATLASVPKSKAGEDRDAAAEAPKVASVYHQVPEEVAKLAARFASQPYTIIERSWNGATFIDVHYLGGNDALVYNSNHLFFQVLSTIKEKMRKGENATENAENLVILIDMLLLAYAKSSAMFRDEEEMEAGAFASFVKNNWGQFLHQYLQKWRDDHDETITSTK